MVDGSIEMEALACCAGVSFFSNFHLCVPLQYGDELTHRLHGGNGYPWVLSGDLRLRGMSSSGWFRPRNKGLIGIGLGPNEEALSLFRGSLLFSQKEGA